MKFPFKITKNRYLLGFTIIVIVLALIRLIFPSIAKTPSKDSIDKENSKQKALVKNKTKEKKQTSSCLPLTNFYDSKDNEIKNKIISVPGFSRSFPDGQDVQMASAQSFGVKPVDNRVDAESRKAELVYIGASPYYYVDPLKSSIPYLVPKAAVLLGDIGRSFYDSLQIKGIPLHQIIVTSVLRTKEDVDKLRHHNHNAMENSCHLYGTTFDICYNRYKTVSDPDSLERRAVRNDTLKWVLSEVLRDFREEKRCYVKYEVKQGCFHITVR